MPKRAEPDLELVLGEDPSFMQTTECPMMAPQSSKEAAGDKQVQGRGGGSMQQGSRNPSFGGKEAELHKGSGIGPRSQGWQLLVSRREGRLSGFRRLRSLPDAAL